MLTKVPIFGPFWPENLEKSWQQCLKVPKCGIFDLFDFNNFLRHEVSIGRGLGAEIKKN